MVLEPRILLDASLVDTTSIEADPEQPTDLQFDVPGTRVLDPRVLDPRLSDPQDPSTQRMITPDLPTIRNWLDTANTHNARLSIIVKLWDAQPEDRISLAETYSSSSVLRDTWDGTRGELRLEPRAGAASPAVAEAFLDALQALQLEASGAEDVSTREVWVFPTLAGASEVAYRVERSSGMVRHYVLDASLESYADARKTAEQQRFFGADGYLGHFSSDAEKSVYGSMAQGRPLWLGLSDKDNAGVWKVSSGPKEGQVFWRETDAGVGIYGSGARSSGSPDSGSTGFGSPDSGSPGSGWGDADWEKLWGTNDFPHRASLGSGFPVALLDGDDAEVSSSEDSKGARIVHHDLLLSSGGFFAREVRIPDTSSVSGGRSDADTGDAAEVAPEKEVLVRKTRASLSRQTRQSPPPSVPPVLDVTGLGGVEVRMQQRLVLTDSHLSATDADTQLAGVVDPSKITFRISAVAGGKLQRLSSSGAWEDMTLATGAAYYAFTFADLQAGKIAFLAGDGRQASGGEQITFKVQAVDDDGNLSDSDDATPGAQTADGSVGVDRAAVATIAGKRMSINKDGVLTPDVTTLGLWKGAASGRSGTLHVVVRLVNKQDGDILSLGTGYDANKFTPVWDEKKGEISLEITPAATIPDIQAALGLLMLETKVPNSASVRTSQVWVFPIFSGVRGFAYRVDETAGLVRYYHYDLANLSVPDGIEKASKRTLFGKKGYFGMYLSNLEKETYRSIVEDTSYLPISDGSLGSIHTTEGKWVILAGPRAGQLFFDEGTKKYGPGAEGSGWSKPKHFWRKGQPYGGATQDVVFLSRNDFMPYDYTAKYTSGSSKGKPRRANTVTHFDFWLSDGAFLVRPVEVIPREPFLYIDFSTPWVDSGQRLEAWADSGQRLVLTEEHIRVNDADTVLPAGGVDPARITLRVSNVEGGILQLFSSGRWDPITPTGTSPNQYQEFTLADLKAGNVAFLVGNGVAKAGGGDGKNLTFRIQAADDGDGTPGSPPHLSDSDPSDDEADPENVSIRVVALKKIEAGQKVVLNDDGVLTPDTDTLNEWLGVDPTLEIFVVLGKGKEGIITPSAGLVQERLSLDSLGDVLAAKIRVSWDAGSNKLSLQGTSSAVVGDFQAVLAKLQLQTVFFGENSYRSVLVTPNISASVSRAWYYVREVQVSASPPNPILEVAFDRLRVDSGQRLVLTEKHISVYDPDTADASSVWLRVTGLTGGELPGGELQRRSTSSATDWTKIVAGGKAYLEFTLAQLRAGRIAILAGDGVASADGGEGKKITFKVQAADAADGTANLSDFNPLTPDKDPVGAEILVLIMAKATAGFRELINMDDALSPDEATLTAWKQEAESAPHGGALHVVVRLLDKRTGDVLSLRSGYDTSKITPQWDGSEGELSLEIGGGTTAAEIRAALALLELDTEVAGSVSMRNVWLFPILSGASGFRYRVDESAGLVRYYFYDSTPRSFADATTAAAGRSLFGKSGYLGVFTSDAERNIYKALRTHNMHLAISDDTQLGTTEGKWVITAGPRQGQVLWDHTATRFGPGADGSTWNTRTDFWSGNNPDNWGTSGEDYPVMESNGKVGDDIDRSKRSVGHHDLWLSEGEIVARSVKVAESPPNPVLRVDFKFQVTAQRPLILTEDHLSVKDIDTRDPLDDTKVDASKIKFRITNIAHGTLHERADTGTSTPWTKIVADGSNAYLEFTLAQLQGGLVAFVPDASASPLTFQVQAADDGDGTPGSLPHLSDSDRSTSDPDPETVSVPVVVLKKVVVGEEVRINDDGVLTPNDDTLDEWLVADDSLQIFVVLGGGKEGIITPAAGLVQERLSVGTHSVSDSKIAVKWDAENRRLSLAAASSGSATRADFQEVLNALQLQTVHFGQVSHRTILVQPDISDMSVPVARAEYYLQEVEVSASLPNPILEVAFDRLRVDSGQRLVLTEKHISVYDPDTADASSVWLRVTGLTGGELQRRSSSSSSDWTKIVAGGKAYLEFTLEQLRAERIAILAGDGLASGEGKKIVFQVQAADAADGKANLSDFNPLTPDKDPVGADIVVVPVAKATAGFRELLNVDGALSPDEATLTAWKQSATTHSGTLQVIVRLLDMQEWDVLSLPTGYDASKVTPRWDQDKGELSLEIASGATEADIQAALKLLELDTEVAGSVSTRNVWLFPILSGASGFRYRVDESAGLVRYYFYDSTPRSFADATTAAAGRSLFGKSGYLGVFTSDAERNIYKALRQHDMHLAISDDTQLGTTEGKWVITAGPRQDQVLWDHTSNPKVYGPGAEGSGWTERNDFWSAGEPDNWRDGEDYPIMNSDGLVKDVDDGSRRSVGHHDLWLSEGEIFARLVEVAESPPNPVLRVDFKFQVTAQRPLILTQDHISVDDLDTRDPSDDTKVDGSKITFRITGLTGGALQRRSSSSASDWKDIVADGSNAYLEFTLADLQGGLVAFVPDASASPLAFDIQAHDGTHLSDFDLSTSDADPTSVTAEVVALKEIDAGKEMPVNDDRRATSGDGALTPSSATLDAWISAAASNWISAAASNPRVLVRIEGTKRGETLFLEDGHDIASITSITSSWSWDSFTRIGILSLQSDGTATVDDFQAVLNALALRTVRSGSASIRTISVRPDIAAKVPQKDYYTRDVLIRESGSRPYVGVQKFSSLKFGQDDRAILSPSEFLVEDFDTSASVVTIVMSELSAGATLYKRNDFGIYVLISPESDGSLEFTLEDLQQGLMAIDLASPLGKELSFKLEARDGDSNWNDVGKSNTREKGVRTFELTGVLALSPEELETDLETGHQKAVPFGGLEKMIEEARSSTDGTGALSIALRNAVPGDRLLMRKSVSGITGAWSEGGHRYILTVSDGTTTSARIDEALAQIYYRASESAGEKERELVISWVDGKNAETVLFAVPLANRPPVLRNWGIAARYHDITPAPGTTEAPLDLGYHPFEEYMPDILDNEGKMVRLEVILVDKAGGVLSPDERVFLSQELLGQLQVQDLVLRDLRSSDKKARALVLESADGRTLVSPEFMSRILQGLLYRHGAAGRDGDVGERREISVAVFDGEVYSQTRTMEVRLVDKTPDPAKYVNTFIGTAFQKRMGVAGLSGNKAGMTFPGASYPFGMVKFSPDTDGGRHGFFRNGGYRRDSGKGNMRFGLQYLSGPGCPVAGVGQFKVGVSGRSGASDDWRTSDESSAPGYYQVGVRDGGNWSDSRIDVELTTGTARTGMMRLTYDAAATGGWIDYGWGSHHPNKNFTSISSVDDEWIVQYESFGMGICRFGWPSASKVGYWMWVSFHIKKDGLRNLGFRGNKLSFDFDGDNREVLGKVSMSYVRKANARENVETEAPGWDFEAHERAGSQSLELLFVERLPSTTSMMRITTRVR